MFLKLPCRHCDSQRVGRGGGHAFLERLLPGGHTPPSGLAPQVSPLLTKPLPLGWVSETLLWASHTVQHPPLTLATVDISPVLSLKRPRPALVQGASLPLPCPPPKPLRGRELREWLWAVAGCSHLRPGSSAPDPRP